MHGMKWIPGALHCLRFWVGPFAWLLLSGILFVTSVIGQDNFISIDCGATTNHNGTDNFIWSADTNHVGNVRNVTIVNASPPYDTLRYFPDKSIVKNCYEFNTTINSAYLLRAGFLYGNYNGNGVLPTFELLYNGNLWATVKFKNISEIVSHEMIALATGQTASVCVASSTLNKSFDPFISSLEIRPVPFNDDNKLPIYGNYLMKLSSRINFGQNNTNEIRYPEDKYDRIWQSDLQFNQSISKYDRNYTSNNLTANMLDFPPSVVMEDARVANTSENMTVEFPAKYGIGIYYISFYFCDFGFDSIMDVYMDTKLVYQGLNVTNITGTFETLKLYIANYSVTSDSYNLTLTANNTKNSSIKFLNAAESYFLEKANTTLDDDVEALVSIKEYFNLSAWMGDPCLPSEYKWSWIDCDVSNSANPARVTGLNLSNMGLHGGMPSQLANLSALTKLDLHNNSLNGSVLPALVNLHSLALLDLSYNNFSGDLPSGLSNISVLSVGNPLLCNYSCISARSSEPPSSMAPADSPVSSTSSSTKQVGVIVGPVIGGVVLLTFAVLGCLFFRHRSQRKHKLFSIHSAHWPPVPPFTEISRVVDPISGALKEGVNDPPLYSFTEMQTITNNFEKRLSLGNAGSLFYGRLANGQEVVVKLLSSNIQISPTEFLNMVTRLTYVSHKNLLRPTGFCADIHRFMFIYEHVQKGSLYDLLYINPSLDWKTRLSILLQVAQGLEYLHHTCDPSIIHGNLKSTNVLMSGDGMVAKVSDFGIYGLSPTVDATSGYLDPEYFKINSLTEKSDVYSFGVLTLEVVCGRLPFDTSLPKDAWNIIDWVRRTLSLGSIEVLPDPCLNGDYNFGVLSRIVQLALKATASTSDERPTMSQIVMEIKEATKTDVGHHVAFTGLEFSDQDDDHMH